jgi:hypothetical protein
VLARAVRRDVFAVFPREPQLQRLPVGGRPAPRRAPAPPDCAGPYRSKYSDELCERAVRFAFESDRPIGLVALPYYEETNPELADDARYCIREVLADAAYDSR